MPIPRPESTRVVLVHHDAQRLRQMAEIVAATPGIELVGRASSGREATRALGDWRPTLVFASMHLPDKEAGLFAARVRQTGDAIRLVFVSPYTDRVGPRLALESGADGYIPKSRLTSEMRLALTHHRESREAWGGRFSPWKDQYGWA